MTRPTRSPVNGPGPTPTPIAVRSWRTRPVSRSARSISGASCSPCCSGRSETSSSDDVLAVVERHGDQRGGGVEGEQHQASQERTPVGGEPTVVVEQVEGQRRRAGLPDDGIRLAVQRHRRGGAAADQQRPAGEGGRAGGVGVADQGGDDVRVLPDHELERLRVLQQDRRHQPEPDVGRRVVQAHERGLVVGRELPVEPGQRRPGRARRGRCAGRPGPGPASRASATGSRRRRGPGGSGRRPRGRADPWRTPRGRRGCRCRPVCGPGQRVEDAPRLGVLLRGAVVGNVAGDEEHVGARVEREQVGEDRLARGRGASGGPPKWVSLTCAMRVLIRAPGRTVRASAGRPA